MPCIDNRDAQELKNVISINFKNLIFNIKSIENNNFKDEEDHFVKKKKKKKKKKKRGKNLEFFRLCKFPQIFFRSHTLSKNWII